MEKLSDRLHKSLMLAATLLSVGCSSDAAGPAAPPPPPPPPPPVSTHRIGVRSPGGRGEFFDRTTNALFTPRGANYIPLAAQTGWTGLPLVYHSTFNVGAYDPVAADNMLARMALDHFNVVRVFLNGCCEIASLGNPAGGLSAPYLANLSDFLVRAKAHDVAVMLTTDGVPMFGGYEEIIYQSCCTEFNADNMSYLTTQGLTAHAKLWHDLIAGLKAQGAPLDAIFAYELVNELSFDSNYPPLSLTSGMIATGNGQSYDMASPDARQAMMDDNLVYWSSRVRDTIQALDPGALVTVGFFEPQGPNPSRIGDVRLIRPYPAIASSSIDFVDLHLYVGYALSMDQYAQNFNEDAYPAKPIVMGEFGAPLSTFGSVSSAVQALVGWQTSSCPHSFSGWLLWTWDTASQPDGGFWAMTSGDSAIEKRLSPIQRADPCAS